MDFDLEGMDQPNIEDIDDIEVHLSALQVRDLNRYERLEEIDGIHNHDALQNVSVSRLVEETDGPEEAVWREFLQKLKWNHYMGDYSFFESRQGRSVNLMLRDPKKVEEFASVARGNTSLKTFSLDISFRHHDEQTENDEWMDRDEYYQRWKLIGEGIGNLKGIEEVQINAGGYIHNHNEPDFEALSYAMQGITQVERISINIDMFSDDDMQFTKSLRYCTKLREFNLRGYSEAEPIEAIAGELAHVNLQQFHIQNCFSQQIPCRELPENIFDLLTKASLTHFSLQRCVFSRNQCLLLAKALETSNVFFLDFQYARFQDEGGELVVAALQTNCHVNELILSTGSLNKKTCERLANLLCVNSSVTRLTITAEEDEWSPDGKEFETHWYRPILLSLRNNKSLKYMNLGELNKWSDDLANVFRVTMEAANTALEELWLVSRGDASAVWQQIVPFLSTNRTLKKFRLVAAVGHEGVIMAASALASNTALETFEVCPCIRFDYHHAQSCKTTSDKDYLSARTVEALGKNQTLKYILLDTCHTHKTKDADDEGSKRLLKALQKNYGIEGHELTWQRNHALKNSINAIARLNRAGRCYLLNDAFNTASAIEVLAGVADDLDALYIHLLENPIIFSS